jgi:oligoribonuclease
MDLEMTGLDHTRDQIVEIATIVTDDELRIIAEGPDLVVHADEAILATMDPIVFDMHTKSGLLPAIRASTVTIEAAGAATLDFIRAHVPDPRTVPLCGNSIGTDRRFLDKYLPEIENYLHYRSVDVSSVKELVKRWYPDLTQAMPRKAGLHRALDDIRSSIEELRYYRGVVFVPPVAVAVATDDAATTAIDAEVVTVDPDDEVFTVDPDDEVFTVDPDGFGEPTAR